jgi:cytochrome c-type biogenesis protein CcmH/NrfG
MPCSLQHFLSHLTVALLIVLSEAPKREEANTSRTYKTKEEVEKSKSVTSSVVVTLLVIAVAVPMLQYYGWV